MKAATKLLIRRLAREEEARAIASVRRASAGAAPVVRVGETASLRLPFTYAPYRLQAADRWWRESAATVTTPERKRRQR
jgi:hypothetical protein